jgi:hypothetical protein
MKASILAILLISLLCQQQFLPYTTDPFNPTPQDLLQLVEGFINCLTIFNKIQPYPECKEADFNVQQDISAIMRLSEVPKVKRNGLSQLLKSSQRLRIFTTN